MPVSSQLIKAPSELRTNIPPSTRWYSTKVSYPSRLRYDEKSVKIRNKKVNGWRSPSPYFRKILRGVNQGPHVTFAGSVRKDGSIIENIQYAGPEHFSGYGAVDLPGYDLDLESRAVNEALSNLKNQKINLAVAFGERAATADFVADTLYEAVDWVKAIRKKDVSRIRELVTGRKARQRRHKYTLDKVLKAPSSLVLQNSYALQPLVADVYGAVDALNDSDLESPERYGVTSEKTVMSKIFEERDLLSVYGSIYCPFVVRQTGFHGCKVRLDYFMENPLLASLASLGVTNPLMLAWELLPFSFVVDWLLPIGSYFDAWDADLGLQFRGGSISRLTRASHVYARKGRPYHIFESEGYAPDVTWCMISGKGDGVRLDRVKLDSSPGPRLPVFKNPLSATHVVNAIALLSANLKLK